MPLSEGRWRLCPGREGSGGGISEMSYPTWHQLPWGCHSQNRSFQGINPWAIDFSLIYTLNVTIILHLYPFLELEGQSLNNEKTNK